MPVQFPALYPPVFPLFDNECLNGSHLEEQRQGISVQFCLHSIYEDFWSQKSGEEETSVQYVVSRRVRIKCRSERKKKREKKRCS